MLGYIIYGDGPKKPELGESRLPGGTFTTLRMGQAAHPNGPLALSRARKSARRLREAGVRSAVFPVDFPYTALFIRQGVCPVDTLPLRRALAAPLTRRRLEEKGLATTEAVVAIAGDRAGRELLETAKALALSYRYVLLSVRGGEEEFARSLRREYGVSLLLGPSKDQLEGAEALVLFDARTDLSLGNPVALRLYDEEQALPLLSLPPNLEGALPEGVNRGQLLAVLREAGALKREQILLGS